MFRRIMTDVGYHYSKDNDDKLDDLEEVAIFADYLPKLAHLISYYIGTSPNAAMTIQNYMTFVALNAHADDLGDAMSAFSSEFENVLSGMTFEADGLSLAEDYPEVADSSEDFEVGVDAQEEQEENGGGLGKAPQLSLRLSAREEICRLKTKHVFGLPLSKSYIDRHFTAVAKDKATKVVDDIKVGFMYELEEPVVDWMDEETKEHAKLKADRMVLNVGYPDVLTDEGKLNEMFSHLEITDDYVDNVFNNYRFSLRRAFEELNTKPDRAKFVSFPSFRLFNLFFQGGKWIR